MPGLMRRLWRVTAALFASVVILLALAVGLFRLVVAEVPRYRGDIQAWASEAIGYPVRIGGVDARLTLAGPSLHVTDARILSGDAGRVLLRAAEGAITLDLGALFTGRLRPSRVSFSGGALRLERGMEGRWRLSGPEGPSLESGGGEPRRLLGLPDVELALEDIRLEVDDLRSPTGPLDFHLRLLDASVEGEQVALKADVGLPSRLGLELRLEARVGGLDEDGLPARWTADATLTGLQLAGLREVAGEPRLPRGGRLDVTAQASGGGDRLAVLRATFEAAEVDPAPEASAAGTWDRIAGQVHWQRIDEGWRGQVARLEVQRDGETWQATDITVEELGRPEGRHWVARADFLRLEAVTLVLAWLPARAREALGALAPRGGVSDLSLEATLPTAGGAENVRLAARLTGLELEPWQDVPGVTGLDVELSGGDREGGARLSGREMAVVVPGLFRAPIELESFAATLGWERQGETWSLSARELSASNAHVRVAGEASLRGLGEGRVAELALDATATDVDVAAASRYLPAGIMPAPVVDWLDTALQAGRVPEGHVELRGPVRGFPWRNDEGTFRVAFQARDASIAFAPGWPAATGLSAEVRFENETFLAEVHGGALMDVQAGPVTVTIPDLARGELAIVGEARGSLAAMRDFVLAAPQLAGVLGPGLEPVRILGGSGRAAVDLALPLGRLEDRVVGVDLAVDGGVAGLAFLEAPVKDITGRVRIQGTQVTGDGITATLAGRPVAASVGPVENGATRLTAHARLSAAALETALGWPVMRYASGEADWTAYARFPGPDSGERFGVQVWSGLEGLAIGLPAPFGKAADVARPLQVQAGFPAPDVVQWHLSWNGQLRAALRMDHGGDRPRLAPLPLADGGLAAHPDAGLVLSGQVTRLDASAWAALDWPEGRESERRIPLMPAVARLEVGELVLAGSVFDDVELALAPFAGAWRLDAEAARIAGRLVLPGNPRGEDPVRVRLERLWLDAAPGQASDEPAEPERATLDPSSVPRIELNVADLRVGDGRYGALSLATRPLSDGIELTRLEAGTAHFQLAAHGHSRVGAAVDDSALRLEFTAPASAPALADMGLATAIEARDTRLEADLAWEGGLRSDWLEVIRGSGRLAMGEGMLTGVEPGAGKAVGLLSLEALPRRLTLDFKEMFRQGLSFDSITGTFDIRDGSAWTTDLVLRGPTVDIGVVGRTGLAGQDYDQTAIVSADLGITLPVAGAVVGGPAVGAALYLLSELFENPLRAQVAYRITGSWDDPDIERVTRSGPGATEVPAASQPARAEAEG